MVSATGRFAKRFRRASYVSKLRRPTRLALRDAEDDDRAVVLERLAPAVGHGLKNRHRGRRGGWILDFGDGAANAVDSEPSPALRAALGEPSVPTEPREF